MDRPRGGWRSAGGRAVVVASSVAFTLIALEGLVRMTWVSPPVAQRQPAEAVRGLPVLQDVAQLAEPNVRGVYRGVVHRTNAAGMRGPEIPRQKDAGVFRIAIAGDSVTMGSGVAEESAYPAVLENALNTRRRDRTYEVLNLGLSGLNTTQVVTRLEQVGLPFDPDLLIYGWTVNDIESPAYREFEKSYAVALQAGDDERAQSPLYLWRVVGPRLRSLRELLRPPADSYLYELNYNYFHNPPAWAQILGGLDRFASLAAERQACAVVFIHTMAYYLHVFHPFRSYYHAVAGAARERGLHVVESFPIYSGHYGTALWVSPYDSHPNAEGHRLLAEALLDGLEQLPPTCWDR